MSEHKCTIYKCVADGTVFVKNCKFCGDVYVCKRHEKLTGHKSCKKVYFNVEYSKRDEAKLIGMYYDPWVKLWYGYNENTISQSMDQFDVVDIGI